MEVGIRASAGAATSRPEGGVGAVELSGGGSSNIHAGILRRCWPAG